MGARATVIIPTFGDAIFAGWAIKSVQQQTVKDIEICIICDGSPDRMVSFFNEIAQEDPRIRVFAYPKSPRTGEPYRDIVIKQTTGNIICYCSHDDLWLPNHIEVVEATLQSCGFTHTIQPCVNLPENIIDENSFFVFISCIDLQNKVIIDLMLNREGFFGLTFGAHTREFYNQLEEGWATTPVLDVPTDLYMWRKFIKHNQENCITTMKITALSFQRTARIEWTEQERDDELKQYFEKMQNPKFLQKMDDILFKVIWDKTKKLESETEGLRYENQILINTNQILINEKQSLLNENHSWSEIATERLEDILDKQKTIDQLNDHIAGNRATIDSLKLELTFKRFIRRSIKRILPDSVFKRLLYAKRKLFGPQGMNHQK